MDISEIYEKIDLYSIEFEEIATILKQPVDYIKQILQSGSLGSDKDNIAFAVSTVIRQREREQPKEMEHPKAKGILLYYDLYPLFASMSNEQAGELTKALFEYAMHGTIPQCSDGMINLGFQMIKPKIDENEQRYRERCRKNQESANSRWHP